MPIFFFEGKSNLENNVHTNNVRTVEKYHAYRGSESTDDPKIFSPPPRNTPETILTNQNKIESRNRPENSRKLDKMYQIPGNNGNDVVPHIAGISPNLREYKNTFSIMQSLIPSNAPNLGADINIPFLDPQKSGQIRGQIHRFDNRILRYTLFENGAETQNYIDFGLTPTMTDIVTPSGRQNFFSTPNHVQSYWLNEMRCTAAALSNIMP